MRIITALRMILFALFELPIVGSSTYIESQFLKVRSDYSISMLLIEPFEELGQCIGFRNSMCLALLIKAAMTTLEEDSLVWSFSLLKYFKKIIEWLIMCFLYSKERDNTPLCNFTLVDCQINLRWSCQGIDISRGELVIPTPCPFSKVIDKDIQRTSSVIP